MKKKTKQFAFWRYDSFPYVIGDEIEEIRDSGHVKPKNYGGHIFYPIAILSFNEGTEIKKQLDALEKERNSFLDTANLMFKSRLKEIFPKALTK